VQFKHLLILACAALAVSCSSGPTIVPDPVIEDPIVNCPSDVSVTAHAGSNPTVTFDVPTAAKGAPPVTVRCTPASGTEFKNGVTTVTCEAVDSRAHKASCSFSVAVTSIPLLMKTKFMAFGDSLTEGKTRLQAPTILQVPSNIFNANGSYPEALNAKLTARYQDQTITMVAYGWGGEKAGEGKIRLRDHWGEFNPDAVMLLEGTNDLLAPDTATQSGMAAAIESVIDALRVDIVFAKQRGARVFLGTLLPMTSPQPPNVVAGVLTLNTRIKGLAVEQGVRLVDLNAAVPVTMIGRDGTHPGPGSEVYNLMADEWLKAIIATMEVNPSPLQ
jgi:lysophospholipase L1-like esterase